MFNPDRLSLIVQPIGENGIRFFAYDSDDSIGVITASGYFTNAAKGGLRLWDLVFVSPQAGEVEPYILNIDSIDDDGHATAVASTVDKATIRTPEYFGARSSVVEDQSAPLITAMESGYAIDGGGRTYYVSTTMAPTSLRGLRNIKLVNMTPGYPSSPGVPAYSSMLSLSGLSGFVLENVHVDGGGSADMAVTSDAFYGNTNGFYGIAVANCTNFVARGLTAEHFGKGGGISFNTCSLFTADTITARYMRWILPSIGDDVIDGVGFVRCSYFNASNVQAYDFSGWELGGAPLNKPVGETDSYHRGILFGTCEAWSLNGFMVRDVGQGIDCSSSIPGNRIFTIGNGTITDVESNGLKLANCSRWGTISNVTVNRARTSGFIFAAQSSSHTFTSLSIDTGTIAEGVLTDTPLNQSASLFLEVGSWITVNGATPSDYNGLWQVTSVVDNGDTTTTIQFDIGASPAAASAPGYCANMQYVTQDIEVDACLAIDCGGSDENSQWNGFTLQARGIHIGDTCRAIQTREGDDRTMRWGVFSEVDQPTVAETKAIKFNRISPDFKAFNMGVSYMGGTAGGVIGGTLAVNPTVEIVSGELDLSGFPNGAIVRVQGEGGLADTLTTITSDQPDGTRLTLVRAGQTITVENGTGNILLEYGGDRSIASSTVLLELIKFGSNWTEPGWTGWELNQRGDTAGTVLMNVQRNYGITGIGQGIDRETYLGRSGTGVVTSRERIHSTEDFTTGANESVKYTLQLRANGGLITSLTIDPNDGFNIGSLVKVGGTQVIDFSRRVYPSGTAAFDAGGTGTPESAVTAPVGSTFRRTDGGAGTTFYVKESGSGNTGWVAK